MATLLNELTTRAGASDTDRDAWLAERALGITATEIRDLKTGRKTMADLVDEKQNGSTFTGNKYTEWGKAREPEMAEWAREFGLQPESRVFHHAEEPRYLASPDAIGECPDGLIIGEFKTSKHDLEVGSREYELSGYAYQMQWAMFVTGAVRCLYIYERHDDNWPDPTPGFMACEWVDRDDAVIAELRELADRFLNEAHLETVDVAVIADPVAAYLDLSERIKAVEASLKSLKYERASHEKTIRAVMPSIGAIAHVNGARVRVGASYERVTLDTKRLKEERPSVYADFVTSRTMPGKLTISKDDEK